VIQGSGMSRYDLTDFEWRVIAPLLPNKPRGVPRVDDRRVPNGIFWVLRSGAPEGCDGKKGGRDHCLGRSRGGLTTKIHALVDRQGLPLRLSLSGCQAHDALAALTLLDRLDPRTIVLADKAYDSNAIRDLIEGQGAVPNIPAKSNRKWKPCFSKTLYRERNQVERFFSKLKHFRRIATRYDKLADNCLAMVKLASCRLWLRAYESTA
jgi:transposase